MSSLTESFVGLPLLCASLLAMTLIFERLWFWQRIWQRQKLLVRTVLDTYAHNPAATLLKLKQNNDLPIARIFLAALQLPDANPEEFRLALESAAQGELPTFQRFSAALNTIVSVAPLLGLLGTVLGLMQSLAALEGTNGGTNRIMEVTAGIDEALVSTAVGLVIAIGTLIFANLFQGLYRRQKAFLAEVGGQLELSYRRQYRQFMEARRDRYPI